MSRCLAKRMEITKLYDENTIKYVWMKQIFKRVVITVKF